MTAAMPPETLKGLDVKAFVFLYVRFAVFVFRNYASVSISAIEKIFNDL